MSKIADSTRDKPAEGASSVAEVLRRVGELSRAKNDAALARALGVSPQTLFSWKKRGNIPFDAAVRYAAQNDIPLDYLLLGRGTSWTVTGAVIPQLLIAIGDALIAKWLSGPEGEKLKPGSPSFLHYCAIVYNRVSTSAGRNGDAYGLVEAEVDHMYRMLQLETQLRRKNTRRRVGPR